MHVDRKTYVMAIALAAATLFIYISTDELNSSQRASLALRAFPRPKKTHFKNAVEVEKLNSENEYEYVHDDNFTNLISALRNGDSDPMKAAAAAEAHNQNAPLRKICELRKRQIVNIGLPRTGTLSFVRVMSHKFKVTKAASCHQLPKWPDYVDEIYAWQANPKKLGPRLKRAIQKCTALADVPNFALYRSFNVRFPSTSFVMTIRGKHSWLNSTRILMESWNGKLPKAHIGFIKKHFDVHNSLGWQYKAYADAWERHTHDALQYFGNNLLLLPVELSDSAKLHSLSTFIGCTPIGLGYPRAHVGNKWKTKF